MINNYYNIPNIPCNARENITDTPISSQKCNGLNPDNVYNTLYPSNSDPLINYSAHNSKKLNSGTKISSSITDTNNCAETCNNKNDCTYFTVQKENNKCFLYNINSTSANDKFNSIQASNSLQTWRKNNLLEGSSNCNLEDNFIEQPTNYFPNVDNYQKTIQTISQPDLSKDECLSACLYDDNCKSVVYAQAKSSCEQYNTDRNDAISKVASSTYDNTDATTYIKNATPIGNRFGAPDDLINYYEKYPKKGKVGDSFCELVDDKCKTSYIVGPNDTKRRPKTGSAASAKTIPAPKICMPPDCVPSAPSTGMKGILKINGNMNIMCKDGDEECRKNVSKTPFFTADQMGLPTKYGTSSPPNPYLPYTAEYNQYNNLKLTSNEMAEKPPIGGFEFPEGCKNWCNNSLDCGGYSYKFGTDGKAQCKYYANDGMKTLRDSLKYENHTTSNIKRGNPLIQEPKEGQLRKPYFNNYSNQQLGFQKINVCIPKNSSLPIQFPNDQNDSKSSNKKKCKENFTNYSEEEEEEEEKEKKEEIPPKYGFCPTNNIPKSNSQGSNCPTPLIECEETTYGCCQDNQTPKINIEGDNCPIIDKSICLNSKYGCCAGTIIPKKYMCDEEEEDCQLTNCALNERQTGDPYAFSQGNGAYCSNNNQCPSGQMCVNNMCQKYNANVYNSLNFVQASNQETKSGYALNDYICGYNTNLKTNKKCPSNYEPVCGTNGKNYSNSCKAINSGTKIQHFGTCDTILEQFYGGSIANNKINMWPLLIFFVLFVIIMVLVMRI